MKTIFLSLLLLAGTGVVACDICGCSINNYNPFLFPQLSKKFVGISYGHRSYTTHKDKPDAAAQYFNSAMITGQYSFAKAWQAAVLVPFQFNKMVSGGTAVQGSGLGDLTLLVNYRLLDKQSHSNRHTITLGGGIKLATGKYTPAKTEAVSERNFQLGTGSNDYLLNAAYVLNKKQWLLSAATSYKYNTQNRKGYRFGDVWNSSVTAAYNKRFGGISLVPYLQLTNETLLQDAAQHQLVAASGGQVWFRGAGADITKGATTVGINYALPLAQNLGQGTIHVRHRFTVQASVNFPSRKEKAPATIPTF